MSASFGQRVLGFNPYEGRGEDAIYDEDEDRYYNSNSSLLSRDVEMGSSAFSLGIDKLGEKRRRPFVNSGIALGVIGMILSICAAAFSYSAYRQSTLMDASQTLVSYICLGCGAAISLFAIAHVYSVYKFSFNECSSTVVRFTDFLQKLSILAVVASISAIMKLWVDAPDVRRPNVMLTFILNPNKVWMLGNMITVSLVLALFMLVGTSIPYRKINRIYSNNIMTMSLMTTSTALAAAILSGVQLLAHHAYARNHVELAWGHLAFGIFLAVSTLSLAASVYKSPRLNALWMLLNLANIGGCVALTVVGMQMVGIKNDVSFFLTALSFGSAVLLTYTWAHQFVWRYVNFYDVPRQYSENQNNSMYASY